MRVEASDAADAMAKLCENRIDLALLDYNCAG